MPDFRIAFHADELGGSEKIEIDLPKAGFEGDDLGNVLEFKNKFGRVQIFLEPKTKAGRAVIERIIHLLESEIQETDKTKENDL